MRPTFVRVTVGLAASLALLSVCTATATAAGAVDVTGDVRNPTILSIDALRGLPSQTQAVTFQSDQGAQSHTYIGVPLFGIVTAAVPVVDSPHASLSVVVVATGADGYSAAVSWGEISPEFAATPVLVAYTEDGHELDRPRLAVPGDVKGGRYVSDLTELRVVNLAHQEADHG